MHARLDLKFSCRAGVSRFPDTGWQRLASGISWSNLVPTVSSWLSLPACTAGFFCGNDRDEGSAHQFSGVALDCSGRRVAQLAERHHYVVKVAGANPAPPTISAWRLTSEEDGPDRHHTYLTMFDTRRGRL